MDGITCIVDRIIDDKNKIIFFEFEKLGFDKDYLIKHRNEFSVDIQYSFMGYRECYYYKGEALFSFFVVYGEDNNITMGIDYDKVILSDS